MTTLHRPAPTRLAAPWSVAAHTDQPGPDRPPLPNSRRLSSAPAGNAVRLRALREADLNASTRTRQTCPAVGLYVLVDKSGDPAPRLAAALAFANRAGWRIKSRTVDSTGSTDPATRPGLARLHTAISRGEIHGIVAVSRTDFTSDDRQYEDELYRLRACGGWLALARNEVAW